MTNLWNKFRWSSPIKCIIDRNIYHYDITKANISVLRQNNIINDELYKNLYDAPKQYREIYIGKLIGKNPELNKIKSTGILEAKRKFLELNNIQDNEILEIDDDSVYIVGRQALYQQISEYVYFKLADKSTSFYNVDLIRYYYYADRFTGVENLIPKGLGKAEFLHRDFMLDFLKELFYTAQFDGVNVALSLLSGFYNTYINRQLPYQYYRTLNPMSILDLILNTKYGHFYMEDLYDPRMKKFINISYNERILREFNKLLTINLFNK